jgi:hypothetical protein
VPPTGDLPAAVGIKVACLIRALPALRYAWLRASRALYVSLNSSGIEPLKT